MTESLSLPLSAHIKSWAKLSRIPFHLVGIAPMLVGTIWVQHHGYPVNWTMAYLAIAAVILTMLSTYYAGEYWDQKEDNLSKIYGKSNFAGGSGAMQEGVLEQKKVKLAYNISALLVMAIGIFIYFYFKTGPWTIPLGAFGLISGYFYSVPPFRFVKRNGLGELLIGLCYAFLPVYIASYLQTGLFDGRLLLISTPISISIFSVIFINEFPDNRADLETGKRNIVANFGLQKSSIIYAFAQTLFIISIVAIIAGNFVPHALWLIIPLVISLVNAILVASGNYRNSKILEAVCGLTIGINLSTCIIMILTLW